jgi:mycothiol synthase
VGFNSRPYAGETDYARMRELLVECCAAGAPAYATLGDIDWWRFGHPDDGPVEAARLWWAGERLAGFAWPTEDEVDLVSHPDHRACEAGMLEWAEAEGSSRNRPTIRAWGFTRDAARNDLLERRGYERTGKHLLFWRRDLGEPLPEPELPPGYVVRSVRGEEDLRERVAAHRDAFSPSRMTVEKYRAVMGAPTYRSELDLVVEAPGGAFAAFCILWFDERSRAGLFEPVGTRAGYRRLGLGKAVVLEGLRRLRRLGARAAYLNSEGGNEPAERLYVSAGFRVLDRNYAWKKEL